MAKARSIKDKAAKMETVFVPKVSGEDPFMLIGHNGTNYQIKCGMNVEVPSYVASIVRRTMKAKADAEAFEEQEQQKLHQVQGAPV